MRARDLDYAEIFMAFAPCSPYDEPIDELREDITDADTDAEAFDRLIEVSAHGHRDAEADCVQVARWILQTRLAVVYEGERVDLDIPRLAESVMSRHWSRGHLRALCENLDADDRRAFLDKLKAILNEMEAVA